jgi:hypothetical protein
MGSLRAINRKAKRVALQAEAERGDLFALADPSASGGGKVYHPMGCTLNFTPGWEIDISGGTAGLCQPVRARSLRLLPGMRVAGTGARSPQQRARLDGQVFVSGKRLAQS